MLGEGPQFRLLYDLGCAFAARPDLYELIPLVVGKCREVLDAEGAAVLLLDAERHELYFPYVAEEDPEVAGSLADLHLPAEQGTAGAVLRSGAPVRIDDASVDSRFYADIDRPLARAPRGRDHAGRRTAGRQDRCARHLRDEPGSGRRGRTQDLPGQPLLPCGRLPDPRSAAPRAPGGHSASREPLSRRRHRAAWQAHPGIRGDGPRATVGVSVARQRARATEGNRAGGGAGFGRGGDRSGAPLGQAPAASRFADAWLGDLETEEAGRARRTTSDLGEARSDFEVGFIAKVLREHAGNVSRAARALGISRVALQRKMKEYGLR